MFSIGSPALQNIPSAFQDIESTLQEDIEATLQEDIESTLQEDIHVKCWSGKKEKMKHYLVHLAIRIWVC